MSTLFPRISFHLIFYSLQAAHVTFVMIIDVFIGIVKCQHDRNDCYSSSRGVSDLAFFGMLRFITRSITEDVAAEEEKIPRKKNTLGHLSKTGLNYMYVYIYHCYFTVIEFFCSVFSPSITFVFVCSHVNTDVSLIYLEQIKKNYQTTLISIVHASILSGEIFAFLTLIDAANIVAKIDIEKRVNQRITLKERRKIISDVVLSIVAIRTALLM